MVLNLTTIDYISSAVILILSFRGVYKGFVSELLSMASIILGVGAAVLFSGVFTDSLEKVWGKSNWNFIVAFLIIFLLVYIIAKIFEGLLHRLFEALHLEKLDRVLGFFLGVGEGILVITIVLFVLMWQPIFDSTSLIQNSLFAQLLLPLMPPPSSIPVPKVNINNV